MNRRFAAGLTPLFHSRRHAWAEHFRLDGATVAGLTPAGRTTAGLLRMNEPLHHAVRESLLLEGETLV